MIIKSCLQCNAEFKVKRSEISRGYGKFCSIKCATGFNNPKKYKIVPNCKCAQCGKAIYKNASEQKNSRSGLFFCNRKCKEYAQKLGGIKDIMPPHYGKGQGKYTYRELFKEDELICFRCGYNEFNCAIEIHHKDGNRRNNKKENLLPLCANCHRALHNNLWALGLHGVVVELAPRKSDRIVTDKVHNLLCQ
jgi:hypothetical protein